MVAVFENFSTAEMKPALQKRSREKADRMLKAGHLLVEKNGYDGMRIGDIVKEAGCSVGSFYERFTDKENFFQLMLDACMSQGANNIEEYLAPARWEGVSAHVIISKTVYQIVKWFGLHKGLHCAALTASSHDEQNLRPFRHSSKRTSAQLTKLLKERCDELNCADIQVSVQFAIQMINGALVLAALTELTGDSENRAENNETIMIGDPNLVVQLTRSICAYLGITIPIETSES